MKKIIFATIIWILAVSAQYTNAESSFEQVSDHCYVLNIEEGGENIAAVSTTQGVLLFDPPPEPDLSVVVEALKNLTPSPVRWMIHTGHYPYQTAGSDYFARQGAVLLSGFLEQASRTSEPEHSGDSIPAPGLDLYNDPTREALVVSGQAESGMAYPELPVRESHPFPEFTFKNRMYLFPDDVEIAIQTLQHGARTALDIFTYIPAEKVLFVGRLFEPESYPDIDVSAGGSALKWIDALGEVIGSVPLLISAIPPEEPESDVEGDPKDPGAEKGVQTGADGRAVAEGEEEEGEKTLEEMITVISARGVASNLQTMKDMLDTSKKLRNAVSRAVKAGRSCESYLNSPGADPYRIYGNFFPYAGQLCKELSPEQKK